MSRKRARATSPERDAKPALSILAAEYNGRKVAIPRKPDYLETISSIKRAFKTLPNSHIILSAFFEEFDDDVEITEETWSDLLPRLTRVTIKLEESAHQVREVNPIAGGRYEVAVLPQAPRAIVPPCGKIMIYISTCKGRRVPVSVSPDRQVGVLRRGVSEVLGLEPRGFSLIFMGERLADDNTLASYGVEPEDDIELLESQVGGKPVIYLFPPARMLSIQAELCLVKSWRFSAIYPLAPIHSNKSTNKSIGESVTWTVDANPDGTLFDHENGQEVAYLFWEAHTEPILPMSPEQSPLSTPTELPVLAFNPACPIINPDNSVLLPLCKVTKYIDDALLGLGLHTEARTSFITYWLPSLSKHKFVTLRFLPQAEYEPAAPLDVTPTPDITTRVFMLFRGVAEDNLDQWEVAQARAGEDTSMWRDIVGVDVQKAADTNLFRVLEWGGMEVKSLLMPGA